MKTLRLKANKEGIETSARIIRDGGLVAVPTETVYGLAASALLPESVKRIFEVKGRPQDNPLIVHLPSPKEIEKYVSDVPPLAKKAIKAFMPGPFTAVLPKNGVIPDVTTAGLSSVAIRCPSNPVMHALLEAAGVPVAAPSANLSGKPSPTRFSHCVNDLDGRVDAILDGGECAVGVESTVVSFLGDKAVICRPGAVTKEMLIEVLGEGNVVSASENETERPVSPGMKYRHYSPSVPVYTVEGAGAAEYIKERASREKGIAVIGFSEHKELFSGLSFYDFGSESKPSEQAARLFAILREIDEKEKDFSLVLCETPSEKGEGEAVRNRLFRAASHKRVATGDRPAVIGVTGKSGAGKSAVSKAAAEAFGYRHIDCDALANDIIWNFPPLCERVKKEFSVSTKKELSKLVFEDKKALERLDFLVLPVIISELDNLLFGLSREGVKGAVAEGATLIESGFAARCDKLIAVSASEKEAVKRITERDGITEEAAKKRLSGQKSDGFYAKAADAAIVNDGSLEEAVAAFKRAAKI